MKIQIKRGTTSKLARVFVQDSGQSDGRGLTGLAQNAAGFVAYYIREGDASPTVIAKSAGTVGTWSSGGWAEIDATNMPGLYEFGLPNTVLASGASVVVLLKGAAGMVPVPLEIQLVAFDTEDATALGLSRLDAAVTSRATPAQILATPANLLATDGSGRVTVGSMAAAAIQSIWDALMSALTTTGSVGKLLADNLNATVGSRLATSGYTAPDNAGIAAIHADTDDIQARLPAALVSGRIDASVGAVASNAITAAALAADAGAEIADAVWDEALAGHATGGSAGAALTGAGSAGDPWSATLPGAYGGGTAGNIVGNRLDTTVGSRASQASVDTVDDFLDTEIAAIKAKTDALPASPAAVGSAMTLDLTQAVPTSNTAQTVGDALNAARAQGFGKWVLSGTSLVLYAANGTTVVRTFTLDDAVSPTTRT